jgi:hypothetical protein
MGKGRKTSVRPLPEGSALCDPGVALPLLLFLVAAGLYARTLGFDFVWDARAQILIDRFIHDPRHWWDVLSLRVLGMDVLDFNRPVHLASLMVDAAIWGERPFGYHLTCVLLHGAVAALIGVVARPHAGTAAAALGGLLFAVHPMQVEAVAEVSYREDLLVALFALGALAAAARWDPARPRGWGAAVVACCFAAVASKESGVAAPVGVAAYLALFRRYSGRAGVLLAAAGAAAAAVFVVLRFGMELETSKIFTERPGRLGGSWAGTFSWQPRIWAYQIWQIAWPFGLCADYGTWTLRGVSTGAAWATLAGAGALAAWAGWRDRLALLGLILGGVAWLAVSNLLPMYRPMADRFLYLPLAGGALVVAGVLRGVAWRDWRMGAGVIGALFWGVLAVRQQEVWRSSLTLWESVRAANPKSFDAHNNLAFALIDAGRFEEAVRSAARAADLTGGKEPDPFSAAAIAFERMGREREADAALREAIRLDARYGRPEELVAALRSERHFAEVLARVAARVAGGPGR